MRIQWASVLCENNDVRNGCKCGLRMEMNLEGFIEEIEKRLDDFNLKRFTGKRQTIKRFSFLYFLFNLFMLYLLRMQHQSPSIQIFHPFLILSNLSSSIGQKIFPWLLIEIGMEIEKKYERVDAWIYKTLRIISLVEVIAFSQQMLAEEQEVPDKVDQEQPESLNSSSGASDALSQENPDFGISEVGLWLRRIVRGIVSRWYFTCEICMIQFENQQSGSYTNCEHQRHFCSSCLTKYVKFKLLFFEIIHCPRQHCNAQLDIECSFFKALPSEVQKRYRKIRTSYQKLHDANFRTCPSESCEGNIVFDGSGFKCALCKQLFCISCLGKKHDGECYMEQIAFFQNILHFRRCPRCKFVIEKSAGCIHMTCLCKYQFCYRCNDTYSSSHRCQVDSQGKIIIKNPQVKSQYNKQEEKKEPSPEEIIGKSTFSENLILALSLLVVLIPLYFVLLSAFFLLVVVLTLRLAIQIIFVIVILMVMGMGPYAQARLKGKGKLCLLMFPYEIVRGTFLSFKEMFSFTMKPMIVRFVKNAKKCWKTIFIDSLSD